MPAEYKLVLQENMVRITFKGVLTRGEVLRMRAALVTDPAYRPGLTELIDLRAVEQIEITYGSMLNMIRHYRQLFGAYGFPDKMVIFAPGDLGFGMARMFETLSEGEPQLRPVLVRSEDEARDALGLAPEAFDTVVNPE